MSSDDADDRELEKMLRELDGEAPFRHWRGVKKESASARLAALYLLRMLVGGDMLANLYEEWLEDRDAPDAWNKDVLSFLGLPLPRPAMSARERGRFLARARRAGKARCARFEHETRLSPTIERSLAEFRHHLNLNEVECGLLLFASLQLREEWFRHFCARSFSNVNDTLAFSLLASAFRTSAGEVEAALAPRGKLVQSGLIRWDADDEDLDDKLQCVKGLPAALFTEGGGPMTLLARQCRPAPAPVTTLADFDFLDKDVRLLKRLFSEALARQTMGVNVLLYGAPGTGKTELARALAAAVASELWEVGCEDEDGDPICDRERMASYCVGQAMLRGRKNAMLVFDEAEDVFPEEDLSFFFMRHRPRGNTKAWLNQLLENNPVPALWLSNNPDCIDAAHVRRFLYVLEVPQPPRRVRLGMLEKQLAPAGVPWAWLERISTDDRLVPGHIERARRLIEHLGELAPEEARDAAEQAIGNTLRASGESGALKGGEVILTRYRPEFLNADTDLAMLSEGIVKRGAGRLCLYGAPGTGKSAFARHLAERAGKPLVYRRASDLLSCWVGETEAKIAGMFQDASRDGAAVLLDEADSFLAGREGAVRNWEITQVNELLTQMESFEGLFIASTNLMDRLDAASIRRFDLKIRFDYLKPEQARAMLMQVLEEHGIALQAEDAACCERIAACSNLTPGDFAAVIRRARLASDSSSAVWWIEALERECRAKPDAPRSTLGFLTTHAS